MKFTQNHITRTEELVRSVLLNDDLFRLVRGYAQLVLVDIIENPNSREDYAASTFAYLNAIRAAMKGPHGQPLVYVKSGEALHHELPEACWQCVRAHSSVQTCDPEADLAMRCSGRRL
jgi:hypothetical protein